MKFLTAKQEGNILRYLANNCVKESLILGEGSTRVTFNVNAELYNLMTNEWGIDAQLLPRNIVIKVLFGDGGVLQHNRECNSYDYYSDWNIFAPIYFCGSMLSIMTKVKPICDGWVDEYVGDIADGCMDRDDFLDCFDDERYDDQEREVAGQWYDMINQAGRLFGGTSDLCQIGQADDGKYYFFDYGYEAGTDEVQTSYEVTDAIACDCDLLSQVLNYYADRIDESFEQEDIVASTYSHFNSEFVSW